MEAEVFKAFCNTLPEAVKDFPFDDNLLTFKIRGKVFAIMSTKPEGWFVLKCDPEYSLRLREEWTEIEPAWHCNKKYWIQLDLTGSLPDELIRTLIRHSYDEVVKKLPKRVQRELENIE